MRNVTQIQNWSMELILDEENLSVNMYIHTWNRIKNWFSKLVRQELLDLSSNKECFLIGNWTKRIITSSYMPDSPSCLLT